LSTLKSSLAASNVDVVVVAETLDSGVNQTYSASAATNFDAVVVADGASSIFSAQGGKNSTSTLYPAGRPLQILTDAYRWGKPVAVIGSGKSAFQAAGIPQNGAPGVYTVLSGADLATQLEDGLRTFKFLDRFPLDQ